jgi:Transglycosylase-like domain
VRKVLVPALAASAAAVPAVAFAATTDNETNTATPIAGTAASKHEIHTDTRVKRHNAVRLVKHEDAAARRKAARKRAARQAAAAPAAAPSGGASPQLEAIAACESGGNPSAIGGGGAYRGKYQFDYGTWASVGGSGDPAAAPESEQDARAAMLLARSGTSPWPVCG